MPQDASRVAFAAPERCLILEDLHVQRLDVLLLIVCLALGSSGLRRGSRISGQGSPHFEGYRQGVLAGVNVPEASKSSTPVLGFARCEGCVEEEHLLKGVYVRLLVNAYWFEYGERRTYLLVRIGHSYCALWKTHRAAHMPIEIDSIIPDILRHRSFA